jgi:hypothetical protein
MYFRIGKEEIGSILRKVKKMSGDDEGRRKKSNKHGEKQIKSLPPLSPLLIPSLSYLNKFDYSLFVSLHYLLYYISTFPALFTLIRIIVPVTPQYSIACNRETHLLENFSRKVPRMPKNILPYAL